MMKEKEAISKERTPQLDRAHLLLRQVAKVGVSASYGEGGEWELGMAAANAGRG